MEQSLAASQSTELAGRPRESTFGVQSLADTLEAAFGHASSAADEKTENTTSSAHSEKESLGCTSQSLPGALTTHPESCKSSPTKKHKRKASNHTLSTPLTPLNVEARSPLHTSAMPSTPKSVSLQSLKLSDEESGLDDVASQAITSSGEEEEEEGDTMHGASSSFPQLVMPSIQMPSRRPFTAKGKAMGKLKVLIAGESGPSAPGR